MKETNLQTFILSEYYSSVLYFDRISFFLLKIPNKKKEIQALLEIFHQEISQFFNSQFLSSPLKKLENENSQILYKELKKIFDLTTQFFNLTIEEDFQKRTFIP